MTRQWLCCSYMNWHVKVVRFKMVCHFSKALECVFTHGLLKPKCFPGLAALLGDKTWGQSPNRAWFNRNHHKTPGSRDRIRKNKTVGAGKCLYHFSSAYLCHTLGTTPVSLGHILKGWDQAKGVVAVITTITQQEAVFLITPPTRHTHVQVDLLEDKMRV